MRELWARKILISVALAFTTVASELTLDYTIYCAIWSSYLTEDDVTVSNALTLAGDF